MREQREEAHLSVGDFLGGGEGAFDQALVLGQGRRTQIEHRNPGKLLHGGAMQRQRIIVGDDPDLEQVTLGPQGAFSAMRKGGIFFPLMRVELFLILHP